jgi:hypothetical protein
MLAPAFTFQGHFINGGTQSRHLTKYSIGLPKIHYGLVLTKDSHITPAVNSSDGSPLVCDKSDSPPLAEVIIRVPCDLRPLLGAESFNAFRY